MRVSKISKALLTLCVSAAIFGVGMQPAMAQDDDEEELIEEIVVTGSYLKRKSQFDSPSPISIIGSEEISSIGAVNIDDITDTLTGQTGSQNNPDAFTQNFSTGTSNVNLRGLGVSSTLVMLNGRRQVQSPAATDRGENFVDTATLVPTIAIERLEVLKDGAAALYGSDAVAGVVNFITRSDFRGFEVGTRYQTTKDDDQTDIEFSALWGGGNESTDIIVAFTYLDRDPLTTAQRPQELRQDTSLFGQPGSYLIPFQPTGPDPLTIFVWGIAFDANGNGFADFFEGLSPTLPALADPDCPAIAAQDPNVRVPSTFPAGICGFDFGLFFNLVAEEERISVFTEVNHDMSNGMHFRAEFGWASNEASRGNSPSFPVLALPAIPASHPNNPFGTTAIMIARAIGAFGAPLDSSHDNEAWRMVGELDGVAGEWDWTVAATYSESDSTVRAGDTLADRFFAALNGVGGPGNNQFYNPFGSQYTTSPNDPAVIADFTAFLQADASSDQLTLETVFVRDMFELGGGTGGMALGFHYRDESLAYDYDDNSNRDNFLFLVGNPDFDSSRDVTAFFGELGLPFSDTLEVQLAARFEDYGDGVDSLDPKLAFIWRPTDAFTLRGSIGTAFRAPSLFQQFGTQTSLVQINDPLNPGLSFRANRSAADPDNPLRPEDADVFNIGASFALGDHLELNFDYWGFDYSDIIIQENAQALINANPTGPQIIRDPATGVLLRINSFYANATSLDTDGFDVGVKGNWDTDIGSFGFTIETTFVNSYDLVDPQAGAIDGVGNRNRTNFATSVPEFKGNFGVSWSTGGHSVFAFVRYTDSYLDDENVDGDGIDDKIEDHTTLDLQYNYATGPLGMFDDGIMFTVGGINVTDEAAPGVLTNGGFDSKVHDPRGALWYVRATFGF